MRGKIFKTFVCEDCKLEEKIKEWLKTNDCMEIDRSAPALTVLNPNSNFRTIIVAVTVTAEKNSYI